MKDKEDEEMTPDGGLPEDFVARLATIVPPESRDKCLASFSVEKPVACRVNTIRAAAEEVAGELAAAGFEVQRVDWYGEALVVPAAQRQALLQTPAVREGRLYIQNLASMLAPLVLDVQPGEEVLDLAAAPGGKTLQMAAMMRNQGRIAAVEAIRERFYKMRALLGTHGASIVDTYLADGRTIGRKVPERFDRVLLDAPCSCEARFDTREPDTWRYWSLRKIKESARKQRGLLRSAVDCLKPGGTLVYCTCTLAPEENELTVAGLLDELGEAVELTPIDCPLSNIQPGLAEWEGRLLPSALARCVRVLPNEAMDAAFLAKLVKRTATTNRPPLRRPRRR